jgi:cholesterol transport system auxiliary component
MENERILTPNRRSLLVLAGASLTLTACGDIVGPPPASKIYILRPSPAAQIPGPRVAWALSVGTPDSQQFLATDRVAISRSADTADYYADAVWQDSLPSIVQGVLVDGFEASGAIDQVARDEEGVRTDYVLKTDIRQFEARYDTADGAPTAVITIEALLIRRRDRDLAARLSVHQQVQASANSIEQAAQALDQALGAARDQIVRWALTAVPRTKLE